jgi:hypothetical protein
LVYLSSNCILIDIIEGKIDGNTEGTGRLRGRRKQLLDDLKEKEKIMTIREEALCQSVENSFWNILCICRTADCVMSQ